MSADLLRRGAEAARRCAATYTEENPNDANGRVQNAVAEWLDGEAECIGWRQPLPEALSVARAYLGSDDDR